MTTNQKYEYIDSSQKLADFCERLASRKWIILDTEFIRESTYRPELCLIQIKCQELLAIVDTLAVKDLSALSTLLHDPDITKVFHAASQDLEIFYWLDKKTPAPLFDTQIAAPLLGYNEQIGYGNLVKEVLGIELSKAHTRADWTRRPLPENQLRYALDDVIYLEQLYEKMHAELTDKKRLDWLTPEFEALTDPAKYDRPARDMWKKMRVAQKLKNEPLSVLQALAEWRELQARETNIPRNWLVKDDVLADIARQMPASVDELSHLRGLGAKIKSKHGIKLVELINDAREREPQPYPEILKKRKLKQQQIAIVDALAGIVTTKAITLNINPAMLATRKLLEECVAVGSSEPVTGWRQPLIASDIDMFLRGKTTLKVKESILIIE